MKNKVGSISMFLLMIFACMVGYAQDGPSEKKSDSKQEGPRFEAPPVQVEVRSIQARNFDLKVSVTGSSTAVREAQVAASITGLVNEVRVQEGEMVKKGQVLIVIEEEIWQARLKEKEAECRRLEADLQRLKSGYLAEEIAEKKASCREVKAEVQRLESELKRKQELYHKRNISDTEWDQTRFGYEAMEAKLQRAYAELKLLEIGFRKELIAAAQADYERAKAQWEEARISLGKTRLIAPFDGVITQKKVEIGEWVVPGTVVASLIDLHEIKISTFIPEKYISLARNGLACIVTVDALPGEIFSGEVIEIIPQASVDRNFPVRILIQNPSLKIKAGMFCRISGILKNNPKALMVHIDALIRKRQETLAIKVMPDGNIEYIKISIGARDEDWFEILDSGGKLKAGDDVVVTNNPSVYPGAKVVVIRKY